MGKTRSKPVPATITESPEQQWEKTKDAMAAASLSVLGGMGHLYLGREKRGYLFLACSALLILAAKFLWPRLWVVYLQWVILTGFDAFAYGKRGRGFFF